jgi:2-polyprenyl-3-methyl-5-hydroxy-6-metoxy-1,4-benzoquinol methylase
LKWLMAGRRFLDVGCNIGCAVEGARRNGFVSTGLDLSDFALKIARNRFPQNRFIFGTIDAAETTTKYDLVYCTEVLEHVASPQDFLRSLASLVASGGILFLTTPDAGHVSLRGNTINWGQVKPPEHITLFTRSGLREALAPYFRSIWFWPNMKPGIHLIARRV